MYIFFILTGVDVIELESWSLLDSGIKDGHTLYLESGKMSSDNMLLVRVALVQGNDQCLKFNPKQPGDVLQHVEIPISMSSSVKDLRDLAGTLLLDYPKGWTDSFASLATGDDDDDKMYRLRHTKHLEDRGELLSETTDKGGIIIVENSNISGGRLLLLEQGNIPIKGLITFSFMMWNPTPFEIDTSLLATAGVTEITSCDVDDSSIKSSKETVVINIEEKDQAIVIHDQAEEQDELETQIAAVDLIRRRQLIPLGQVMCHDSKALADLQNIIFQRLKLEAENNKHQLKEQFSDWQGEIEFKLYEFDASFSCFSFFRTCILRPFSVARTSI